MGRVAEVTTYTPPHPPRVCTILVHGGIKQRNV